MSPHLLVFASNIPNSFAAVTGGKFWKGWIRVFDANMVGQVTKQGEIWEMGCGTNMNLGQNVSPSQTHGTHIELHNTRTT
mmetsp:Transcript_77468/g.125656  ORF Transcript_77468/g.125656 Transcript_77468/m.125656 type:complete len:80 (+) Transcript_77468:278-517(+)